MTTRWKLTLEYDGTPFVGWQKQRHGPSIQQCLEQTVTRVCQERRGAYGAGRTDAGVHALAQVCHVDLEKSIQGHSLKNALNYYLRPYPIVVLEARTVDPRFHARFSAIKRLYLYRIINRSTPLALEKNRAWHISRPLDLESMREAASRLIGYHDFTTFCKASSRSPMRTLDDLKVVRSEDVLTITAVARSFLYSQVRAMVGAVVWVGLDKWSVEQVQTALARRNRNVAAPIAPARGLYFQGAEYPSPL